MKALLYAIGFLTVLPVPAAFRTPREAEIAKAAVWFPMVGLIPGLILTASAIAVNHGAPSDIGAFVAVAATVIVTGALHIDGLGDFVDSFGGKSPEETYRIMKDSRIGTFGSLAIFFALLGKYIAFHRLFSNGAGFSAMALIPVISRWSLLLTIREGSHASPTGGASSAFLLHASSSEILVKGTIVALIIFIPLSRFNHLWLWPIAVLIAMVMRFDARRRIGGITGDVLGAQCELAELLMFLILAARM